MTVNCKICGKQFDSFRGLNGHMNAHLPSHRKRAESELCDNCSGAGATIAGCTCGYMDYLKNAEGEEIYWNASCKPCYWESRFISTDKGQLPDYCPQCNKAVTLVAVDVENNLLAAEGDEELDDEDYWEPYLEALEVLWWHCVEYVDYASETYCGIVECINLWSNVAEHSSAHDVEYIVNKVHKFKLEAIRYIWDEDPNYIWEKLEFETRKDLENFNPEDRRYEGKNIPISIYSGWPSLKTVKEVFNPRWLPERGTAYAFDLYDAEEYTKRTGSKVTKGRKQRWIPVAIEYLRKHGKSTAAEIHPSLPDHRSAATPIHAMALSNRLIRMPDIFIVDKSRKPYTYSLVETKEMSLEDDERICFTCGEITSDWDLINEGYECSECSELNRTDYERRKFGVEAWDLDITTKFWFCAACNDRYEDRDEADECCLDSSYMDERGGWHIIHAETFEAEYCTTCKIPDHDSCSLTEDCPCCDNTMAGIYRKRFGADTSLSELTVHVEVPDKGTTKSITFEMPTHILKDHTLIHEAIENRLMDILQQPFGGWDLISTKKLDAESFEANYDPSQARDGKGRWTDTESNKATIDLDSDELSALADAIRQQDETFPEVDMLLEQIGDTPENRELVFQEMLDVLTGFISEVMDKPQIESPEEYYKYILEEPAEDEMGRLYRQANYYAQFKNSIEIEEALEELHFQYQMVKELDADINILESIEKDINFVELVSRVQDMQREYTADWNPTQPRVPTNCPKCKKEEPCPCPKPGPPGKGGKGGTNPLPPIPSPDHDNNQWVNRQTGEIYRGKKPSGAQWRLVEMVPIVINGKQHYVANILDEIVKMWPPSSVIYRRNPPLIVIADKKINLKGLSVKGLKIDGNNITYE